MKLPIHREGWPFIAISLAITILAALLSPWAGLVCLIISLWVIAFFRDPDRQPPVGPRLLVSPADGRVLPLIEAVPPAELVLEGLPRRRISIFMNVFNVHVNRIPCDGEIAALAYRPGKFFNASFDKASESNERMSMLLRRTVAGIPSDIILVQIAGLVARRIRNTLREGQSVCRGDRFGIIRFGSRVDVYLPDGVRVLVSEGQKVRAGETALAAFPD